MENLSREMKRLPLYAEREAVQNIKTTPIKRHCAILSHGGLWTGCCKQKIIKNKT